MGRKLSGRSVQSHKPRKIFRVYTEGAKTEPNYLKAIKQELRLSEIDISIYGCGDHTLPLVEFVIKEKEYSSAANDDETEWWVVFDRDDHNDFNKAIECAETQGINVAYSNEAFELWLILHFEYLQTSYGRDNFSKKLTNLLGRKYEKSDPRTYEAVKDLESVAIRNAKRLEQEHNNSGVTSYIKRDPSTTMYKLIERLRALKTGER